MRENGRTGFHYGWAVLLMGVLAIFGALGLARFGYSMVLPAMQADLGLSNGQAGLLATIGVAGYLALALSGGAMASRYGVRLVATAGLVLVGVGMVFTGFSKSFFAVAAWSSLSGIGSGAVNVAVMGLWPAWFARKKRGLASGVAVSGSSLGLIFTGFTVPRILAAYGDKAWHTCWIVFGVISILLAAGCYVILRNKPSEKGLAPIGCNGESMPLKGAQAGKGRWKDVYLSAPVWFLGLVYIAFGFSYIIFMTFFGKHLVSAGGYTGQEAGRLFMVMGWISILSGLVWGTLSDYIGRKNTLTVLYLFHALAFGLFALAGSPVYFVLAAVLYGLSAWSIPAIMAAACGDIMGPEMAPAALGFITLFFGLGQVAGPVVAGAMADATGSFSPVFILSSAVALLGAGGSAFLRGSIHG